MSDCFVIPLHHGGYHRTPGVPSVLQPSNLTGRRKGKVREHDWCLSADITLDHSTESVNGIGTGAAIIYPHAKLFNPAHILQQHGLSQ